MGVFVAMVGLAAGQPAAPHLPVDPFRFLSPGITIDATDRTRLDQGEPVVRMLPGRRGFVMLLAAIRVDVTPERFLDWAVEPERLQRGKYVPQVGRFSDVPRVSDVEGLTAEPGDIEELRRCRPGRCGVKIHGAEIKLAQARLQGPDWRRRGDSVIRELLVQRATAYLARGDAGLQPYQDNGQDVVPGVAFGELVSGLPFLHVRFPGLVRYLVDYPLARTGRVVTSRLYWSKEALGVKPIVGITHHVVALHGDPRLPEVLVVGKQVFATHYKNASVTVTALAGGPDGRYLVYLHRSDLDMLEGFLGGLTRRMIERRIRGEAPRVLRELRFRLEHGAPEQTQ